MYEFSGLRRHFWSFSNPEVLGLQHDVPLTARLVETSLQCVIVDILLTIF
jgi:hypothetical protein